MKRWLSMLLALCMAWIMIAPALAKGTYVESDDMEEALLGDADSAALMAAAGDGTYIWPISTSCPVTAGWTYPSNGDYHGATDFGAAPGTPVYAIAAGTIIKVSDYGCQGSHRSSKYPCPLGGNCPAVAAYGKSTGSYGNRVVIDHGNGTVSYYCHLLTGFGDTLKEGQTVRQGETIALSGASGNTNGAHLHLGMTINGATVDPQNYLTKTNVTPPPVPVPGGQSPRLSFDAAETGNGLLYVQGWAYDPDDLNAQLEIHVYLGTAHDNGKHYFTTVANQTRTDVDGQEHCGPYHGFAATFDVSSVRGSAVVRVAALNVGGGDNTWSGGITRYFDGGSSPVVVNPPSDDNPLLNPMIYNRDYYYAARLELRSMSDGERLQHWLAHGINESPATPVFNASWYKSFWSAELGSYSNADAARHFDRVASVDFIGLSGTGS